MFIYMRITLIIVVIASSYICFYINLSRNLQLIRVMAKRAINRIKITLVEQGRTNKWLATKLEKNTTTVSRWCTNEMQPSLETLVDIAQALNVDVKDLLLSTKDK